MSHKMVGLAVLGSLLFSGFVIASTRCIERLGLVDDQGNPRYNYSLEVRHLSLEKTGDTFSGEIVPLLELGQDLQGHATVVSLMNRESTPYWSMNNGQGYQVPEGAGARVYIPFSEIHCDEKTGSDYFDFRFIAVDIDIDLGFFGIQDPPLSSMLHDRAVTPPSRDKATRVYLNKGFIVTDANRVVRNDEDHSEQAFGRLSYQAFHNLCRIEYRQELPTTQVYLVYALYRQSISKSQKGATNEQILTANRNQHLKQVAQSFEYNIRTIDDLENLIDGLTIAENDESAIDLEPLYAYRSDYFAKLNRLHKANRIEMQRP